MRRVLQIFLIAFTLNVIWENMHAFLYASYKGGQITEFILFRASLFDACVITLILIPFMYSEYLQSREWLIFTVGTMIAVVNEWYGLSTSRWLYTPQMPLVPLLHVGVTPFLQLGVTGYITRKVSKLFTSSFKSISNKGKG
jgi:hypothetical protein